MRRLALITIALCATASLAAATVIAPGPYYARGDFYSAPGSPGSGTDGTWGYSPAQQLYDDGLLGDGAANDGVYGVDIATNTATGYHEFTIANADWSFGEPTVPEAALINGRVYVMVPGEVIHFRLDLSAPGGGWEFPAFWTLTLIVQAMLGDGALSDRPGTVRRGR